MFGIQHFLQGGYFFTQLGTLFERFFLLETAGVVRVDFGKTDLLAGARRDNRRLHVDIERVRVSCQLPVCLTSHQPERTHRMRVISWLRLFTSSLRKIA